MFANILFTKESHRVSFQSGRLHGRGYRYREREQGSLFNENNLEASLRIAGWDHSQLRAKNEVKLYATATDCTFNSDKESLKYRCLGHVKVRKSSSDSMQDFYYLSVESFQDWKDCGHQLVLVASCWKWGNRGPERLIVQPKSTQLARSKAEPWIQILSQAIWVFITLKLCRGGQHWRNWNVFIIFICEQLHSFWRNYSIT